MAFQGYNRGGEPLHWWHCEKNEAHSAIFDSIRALDEKYNSRFAKNLHHLRMYSNSAATGLSGKNYSSNMPTKRISLNICKNLVDAATSKIATKKVKPMFLTIGGDYTLKKKAKDLNQYAQGVMYSTRLHKKAVQGFRDGCIFDRGFLHVCAKDGKPYVERVFPHEIIVDEEDAKYGEPTVMFRHKEVPRSVLMKRWPKYEGAIEGAAMNRDDEVSIGQGIADQVSVVEAWRLPSSPDAEDGRHVICIDQATFVDEPWDKCYFPFASFSWSDPAIGFWGHGIVSEVESIQIEINMLLRKSQREMNLGGFKVFVHKGSEVNPAELSSKTGSVVHYVGEPPKFANPPVVSVETFQQIENLERKAYEITGISRMSAQAMKPAGLESGKALREYYDIESERFQAAHQAYEQFVLDAVELLVDVARDLAETDPHSDLEVMAKDHNGVKVLDWSDVDLDKDKYVMQVFPTNFLPATPAGKIETMKDMGEIGLLEGPDMLEMLDYPDIESVTRRKLAPYKEIEKACELMLYEGEPQFPEPFTDLALAGQMAQLSLIEAKNDGVPEERLQLCRNYIARVKAMLEATRMPDGGAVPPGAPPQPPGTPERRLPPGPEGPPPGPGAGMPQGAPGMNPMAG